MARIETNVQLDMNSAETWYGTATTITQNQITITAGQLQGTYRGYFTFDQYGRVFGQLNSYETTINGAMQSRFSQLSVDAFTAFNAIGSNNATSLYPSALSGPDIFFGSNFNDILFGFAGDDTINGGFGADELRGDVGNDRLNGQDGNDTLTGNEGDDRLNGGPGIDTAAYSGNQSSYTLTLSPTSSTLTDRRPDGNGNDTLIDMEFLDFDTDLFGAPFDLTQFGGTAGLSEQNFESFIELYIAYFNRAPDAIGLNFWGTAFANGTTLEDMATLFVGQDETLAAYPSGTSNSVFAETVYNNVLGRTPDQAGFDFWVGELNSGVVSRDQFILEVLRGVQPGSTDRSYLDSKVDVGAYFAVHKGMSDTGNASAAMALFDGSEASIDASVAAIDGYYADALDPTSGEFLLQVVGVLDDPFAGV